jgi:hypothetical protein
LRAGDQVEIPLGGIDDDRTDRLRGTIEDRRPLKVTGGSGGFPAWAPGCSEIPIAIVTAMASVRWSVDLAMGRRRSFIGVSARSHKMARGQPVGNLGKALLVHRAVSVDYGRLYPDLFILDGPQAGNDVYPAAAARGELTMVAQTIRRRTTPSPDKRSSLNCP